MRNEFHLAPTSIDESPTPLDEPSDPTDAELWAIEAEAELLAAELVLVDAECAWYRSPGPGAAADYLAAVAEIADLHMLYGYDTSVAPILDAVVREVA